MTPTPARHGGGFLKFLAAVVVLAALVVLGWGVFANWERDHDDDGEADGFTFRVVDPDWWQASKEDATPLVAQAKDWAMAKKEDIWGDGGYLDQSETWLEEWQAQRAAREGAAAGSVDDGGSDADRDGQDTSRGKLQTSRVADDDAGGSDAADTASAVTADPGRSKATVRLEERIEAAEGHFAEGLEAFRAANPDQGWTDERVAHYTQAREHFTQVRRILVEEEVVDDYQGMDDHDPVIAKKAAELAQLNQKLLYDATKSSGGY